MKKVILSVFSLGLMLTATAVKANTVNVNNAIVVSMDNEKTAVKAEELPEAVKTTLAGFEGFAVAEVFLIKSADASYYEATLTKGEEKQVVKVNVDGTLVK